MLLKIQWRLPILKNIRAQQHTLYLKLESVAAELAREKEDNKLIAIL